jgi:hypothetical protein
MSTWNIIESLLSEELQYRGDTFVSYSDLVKLFVGNPPKSPGFTGQRPDPKGGVATGNYTFDPSILALGDAKKGDINAWWDELDTALARATTASSKEIGAGMGSGGTMTKGTYGNAGAMMKMAPVQPHHNDRLGSTMDRYDVILVADVDMKMNRRGIMVPVATLKRVAWAPSMGTQEERAARLQGLLSGRSAELPRRPQPHRPVMSKDDQERQAAQAKRDAERYGGGSADDEDRPKLGARGGAATNQSFRDKVAKMNKDYEPTYSRASQRKPDEEDALFWTPGKKRS